MHSPPELKPESDSTGSLGNKRARLPPLAMITIPESSLPFRRRPACAECRRLKHKCNREFPCENCKKRGCAAICPDGKLKGKAGKYILVGSERLHEQIAVLTDRIRDLEGALQDVCGGNSHPLLTEELLKLKIQDQFHNFDQANQNGDQDQARLDDFGSLSLGESGQATYFGVTANAIYYIFQNEDQMEGDTASSIDSAALEIQSLGTAFPFAIYQPDRKLRVQHAFKRRLPDLASAQDLVHQYFEKAAWLHRPILEPEVDEIIQEAYVSTTNDKMNPHKYAALFLIFAIGTLMHDKLTDRQAVAGEYYKLAQAAMSLENIFDSTSLLAVQDLLLMACYIFFAGRPAGDGTRWGIIGVAVKLAQTLGLHRDGNRFKLTPDDLLRRRRLFWELFAYDSLQSITFGRPPSFNLAHIDVELPEEPRPLPSGEHEMDFYTWKYKFTRDILAVVHEQCFGGKPPTYQTIQNMDQKIRRFYVPPSLRIAGMDAGADYQSENATLPLAFQQYTLHGIRETIIFYLHRNFVTRALNEHPEDPLKSLFGKSVFFAYESARSFMSTVHVLHSRFPETLDKIWFIWSHVVSSCVAFAAIVTKCPSIAIADSALTQLQKAVKLFRCCSFFDGDDKTQLVLEQKLGEAESAMQRYKDRGHSRQDDAASPSTSAVETLGGETRLLAVKPKPKHTESPTFLMNHDAGFQGFSSDAAPEQTPYYWNVVESQTQQRHHPVAPMYYPMIYEGHPVATHVDPSHHLVTTNQMSQPWNTPSTFPYISNINGYATGIEQGSGSWQSVNVPHSNNFHHSGQGY